MRGQHNTALLLCQGTPVIPQLLGVPARIVHHNEEGKVGRPRRVERSSGHRGRRSDNRLDRTAGHAAVVVDVFTAGPSRDGMRAWDVEVEAEAWIGGQVERGRTPRCHNERQMPGRGGKQARHGDGVEKKPAIRRQDDGQQTTEIWPIRTGVPVSLPLAEVNNKHTNAHR